MQSALGTARRARLWRWTTAAATTTTTAAAGAATAASSAHTQATGLDHVHNRDDQQNLPAKLRTRARQPPSRRQRDMGGKPAATHHPRRQGNQNQRVGGNLGRWSAKHRGDGDLLLDEAAERVLRPASCRPPAGGCRRRRRRRGGATRPRAAVRASAAATSSHGARVGVGDDLAVQDEHH